MQQLTSEQKAICSYSLEYHTQLDIQEWHKNLFNEQLKCKINDHLFDKHFDIIIEYWRNG